MLRRQKVPSRKYMTNCDKSYRIYYILNIALSINDTHKHIYCHNCFMRYSIRPILFVLFEKSNFLREYHLLSCLPFKIV